MAEIERAASYLKKVQSQMGIEAQMVESDAVHTIADAQIKQGETEMFTSFAKPLAAL